MTASTVAHIDHSHTRADDRAALSYPSCPCSIAGEHPAVVCG